MQQSQVKRFFFLICSHIPSEAVQTFQFDMPIVFCRKSYKVIPSKKKKMGETKDNSRLLSNVALKYQILLDTILEVMLLCPNKT